MGGGYSLNTDGNFQFKFPKLNFDFNFELPTSLGKISGSNGNFDLGLQNNGNWGKIGEQYSFSSYSPAAVSGDNNSGSEEVSEIEAGNAALGSSDRDVVSGALDGVRGLDVDGTAPVVNAEGNVVTSEGNVVNAEGEETAAVEEKKQCRRCQK